MGRDGVDGVVQSPFTQLCGVNPADHLCNRRPRESRRATGCSAVGGAVMIVQELRPRDVAALATRFSSVWVRVSNDSAEPVAIDPSTMVLYDQSGRPWLALDHGQRVSA